MSSTVTVQDYTELKESGYSKQLVLCKSPQIADVINAISDDKALTIFNTVALSAGKTDILISTLGLTRKQFYSKMERLTKHGLLVRRNGRYYLTVLGKVVYELQSILGVALDNYWKLKAIDSLQTPAGLPDFELNKLIDSLLENTVLKNIVLAKVM
jgi:predicted transcriptional regulator